MSAHELIAARRTRWSRERFDHVAQLGVFDGLRVELMRGDVVDVAAHGVLAANAIEALNERLGSSLVGRARVRVQLPLIIDDETEVIPDIAIVDKKASKNEHPSSGLLVVEVSDSSSRYDRVVKAPLYAEARVTEYWLVDASKKHVDVFSSPRNGEYSKRTRVTKGALAVPGFSDVLVPLATLFG
ncbi:MAG: Uma2 family endonuclease [Archangium sp.]